MAMTATAIRRDRREIPVMDEPTLEKFWARVEKSDDGCWLWTAGKNGNGYGQFYVGSKTDGSRRAIAAHRVSYVLEYGPIPDELEVDHVKARGCVSTACVRPDHLEPVTHAENLKRGRFGAATHCPKGHAYDDANTIRRPDGGRDCRECHRISKRLAVTRRTPEERLERAAYHRAWRAARKHQV